MRLSSRRPAFRAAVLPALVLTTSVGVAAPAFAQDGAGASAPAAPARPGALDLGSLGAAPGAGTPEGSLAQVLPSAPQLPGAGSLADAGATGSADAQAQPTRGTATATAGAESTSSRGGANGSQGAGAGQGRTGTVSQYATGQAAPGTFDPEALAQVRPETAATVGAVASLASASAALSLGPQGSSTGSATLAGILPGITYVPGTSSLMGGEFLVGGTGLAVSEMTIFQTVFGFAMTGVSGYFDALADKQEAAELTDADIATWTNILDSVDEVRAVFSLPPLERSDPHRQVPTPIACRRGFQESAKITEDEAAALCEEATAVEATGRAWVPHKPGEAPTPDDIEAGKEQQAKLDKANAGKVPETPEALGALGAAEDRADPIHPARRGGADGAGAGAAGGAAMAAGRAAADNGTGGGNASGNGNAHGAAVPAANPNAGAAAARGESAGLANTGAPVAGIATTALALIAAGGALVFGARGRRNA